MGTHTEMGQAQADVFADKSTYVVSVFQTKIMRIVQVTVSCSLCLVIAVLVFELLDPTVATQDAIIAALVILIAAIPIALPLVMQVVLALGASFLAKEHHAIVTSIPALQDIASMSILCSVRLHLFVPSSPEFFFNEAYFTFLFPFFKRIKLAH